MLPSPSQQTTERSTLHLLHRIATRAFILIALASSEFISNSAIANDSADHPNIMVILADDMGYGDVQALNPQSRLATPHLDRLANAGAIFRDAHTPSGVCTPTRYGLLTGRYCWRSRLKRGVLNGYGEPLIETDRLTIAGFLRKAGYETGIVGKWHLGLGFRRDREGNIQYDKSIEHGPNDLGFDFSYIIPASLDFPPYVFLENGRVTDTTLLDQPSRPFPEFLRKGPRSKALKMEDVLDNLVTEAGEFIQRHQEKDKDKPFFLYVPLTAPHKPVWPHPRFQGRSQLGPYGDFVTQVDSTVGDLLAILDQFEVAENTLVIYTSDNGSFMYHREEEPDHVVDATVQAYASKNHQANYHFRGTKADIWEGGHRVPFFVRWPARVDPGTTCDVPICLTDVFATVATIVDKQVPSGAAPDSFSFQPAFDGKKLHRSDPIIHHSASGMFAVRDGNWKLVLGNGSGGREMPRGIPFEKPYQLFDLSADVQEKHNVISDHPEIASRMEESALELRRRP